MSIQAQSIGEPLARIFERGTAARVLARYDSTLALETPDGKLWAITTRRLFCNARTSAPESQRSGGAGQVSNPGAMRVVVSSLPKWGDGAAVCVRDGKIFADDMYLNWGTSPRFDPAPRQRAMSTTQRASAARTVAGALARWQLPDALGFWDELSEMWEPLVCELISPQSPLVKGDRGACVDELVLRLIGRGPGLTPTGDDFLQALLVTLASGDAADRAAFESLRRAVAPHLSRSTRLSRSFLEEAMRGWAFGALKDLLDGLPAVTQGKVDALLSIGATSGPAYAFGVLMGLSWNED